MNIDIQSRDFGLTSPLERHVREKLRLALANRYYGIKFITVRLGDVNGPRGGEDKYCYVHIGLANLRDVVVKDRNSDMYAAICRAADRAGGALNRRLARRRKRHRKVGWDSGRDQGALALMS
jgi:ribosome-associated translation inhibitor RaiA